MDPKESTVKVILAFYNGKTYLQEQLESIVRQDYPVDEILILDDCSPEPIDLNMIEPFKESVTITIRRNAKNLGYARNFLNGLSYFKDQNCFIAFSDQDDVWLPNKLSRAIASLNNVEKNVAGLYCGRTKYVDDTLKDVLGYSPSFKRKPSFKNALVQNIAGGNTMVLNSAAAKIVRTSGENCINEHCISHDWWTYMIIVGSGGHVIYDTAAQILYRQHANNIIGSNSSFRAKLYRLRLLLLGKYKEWNSSNISMLNLNRMLLTEANVKTLEQFAKARTGSVFERLYFLWLSGVYRQTKLGNLALFVSALTKRL